MKGFPLITAAILLLIGIAILTTAAIGQQSGALSGTAGKSSPIKFGKYNIYASGFTDNARIEIRDASVSPDVFVDMVDINKGESRIISQAGIDIKVLDVIKNRDAAGDSKVSLLITPSACPIDCTSGSCGAGGCTSNQRLCICAEGDFCASDSTCTVTPAPSCAKVGEDCRVNGCCSGLTCEFRSGSYMCVTPTPSPTTTTVPPTTKPEEKNIIEKVVETVVGFLLPSKTISGKAKINANDKVYSNLLVGIYSLTDINDPSKGGKLIDFAELKPTYSLPTNKDQTISYSKSGLPDAKYIIVVSVNIGTNTYFSNYKIDCLSAKGKFDRECVVKTGSTQDFTITIPAPTTTTTSVQAPSPRSGVETIDPYKEDKECGTPVLQGQSCTKFTDRECISGAACKLTPEGNGYKCKCRFGEQKVGTSAIKTTPTTSPAPSTPTTETGDTKPSTTTSGQSEVIKIKGDYSKRFSSTYEASFTFKDFPEGQYEVRLQYRKKGVSEWNNISVAWSLGALPKEGRTIKVRIVPSLYIKESGVYEFRLIGASNNPSPANYDNVSEVFEIEFQFLEECGKTCYGRDCGDNEACSVEFGEDGSVKKSSCILSSKCGSTCDAWVQKYEKHETKFSKRDKPCSEFPNCAEVKKDDYGDEIKCENGKYLCYGSCGEKTSCPFTCVDDDVCKLKKGSYKSTFSCPKKKVIKGFEIPQVCCQLETAEINEDVTAVVDTVLAALKSGLETESESFTGFGVIKWFNVLEIFRSGNKINNLDDQIALHTVIRTDLESGRTMEEILNTYRSFLDNKGKINEAGRKFFQEKYGDLVHPGKLFKQYDEECIAQIVKKIEEDPKNRGKSETYECENITPTVKNDFLAIRTKEETIVKNSITPLTLALEKYDKAVRNNEDVDELNAEIFYQTAELVKKRADEGLAVEFYNIVVQNYKDTSRFADAEKEMKRLNSKGHKAWVMTAGFGVAMLGLDNLIPINPCKGPVKIGCKFVGKAVRLGAKVVISPLKLAFKLPRLLLRDKENAIQTLIREGVEPENAKELVESGLLKKVRDGSATEAEKQRVAQLLDIKSVSDLILREFQKSVTEFLILNGDTVLLDDFYRQFPQYKAYNLDELKANLPEYTSLGEKLGLGENNDVVSHFTIDFKASTRDKFIYRAEGSGYDIRGSPGEIDMLKLLDTFKKQNGIGRPKGLETFATQRPTDALGFSNSDKLAVWILKKSAVTDLKPRFIDNEYIFDDAIPFQYVEKLLVTEKTRVQILKKYGAENTELFGRPLQDVVAVGIDPNDAITFRRTILELNLQTPGVTVSEAEKRSIETAAIVANKEQVFDRFVSVLGKSEITKANTKLREHAIKLLGAGAGEDSIVDVLEHGLSASKISVDDAFNSMKRIIKNEFVASNSLSYAESLGDLQLGIPVLSTINSLKSKQLTTSQIVGLLDKSNTFDDFIKWGKATTEDLKPLVTDSK